MRATISFVNHPTKPDAKYGNLKTSDNQRIMVPIANLGQYERGRTYDIPTQTKTWTPGEPPVIVAQPYQEAPADPPDLFPPSDTVGRTSPPPAPAATPAPFRGNPEARGIFLTGVVGRAMGSGKFAASEIEVLLDAAMAAYDRKLGG